MKYVFKLLIILFALTIPAQSFAQPRYGFKGGFNFANMAVVEDYIDYGSDCKMNLGFNIGGTVEFKINEVFSFETGLYLSERGYKTIDKENDYKETIKLTLFYLDIPLTGKAYFDVSGTKFYALLGPYIGTGLFALTKDIIRSDGNYEKETMAVEWGSGGDLKRFDFGLSFGTGVEINAIHFELKYNLGLTDVSPSADDSSKLHHRALALSIGCWF